MEKLKIMLNNLSTETKIIKNNSKYAIIFYPKLEEYVLFNIENNVRPVMTFYKQDSLDTEFNSLINLMLN